MTVHEKLRAMSEVLTQEKVAEAMQISTGYLREILREHRTIGRRYIENLAAVYPISADEFLDESRDFVPPTKKRKKKKVAKSPVHKVAKRCLHCDYYGGSHTRTCDYCILTGEHRGCPPGDQCTKYKPRTHRRRPMFLDFGGGENYDL